MQVPIKKDWICFITLETRVKYCIVNSLNEG